MAPELGRVSHLSPRSDATLTSVQSVDSKGPGDEN